MQRVVIRYLTSFDGMGIPAKMNIYRAKCQCFRDLEFVMDLKPKQI